MNTNMQLKRPWLGECRGRSRRLSKLWETRRTATTALPQPLLWLMLLLAPQIAHADATAITHAYPGGPAMVELPQATDDRAGTLLGQDSGYLNEKTAYRVRVPYRLAMGQTEVTFAQWDLCMSEGMCQHRPDDHGWGRGNRPVINVDWNDVQQFLGWINKKAGTDKLNQRHRYRLPTEAEWEYAARAGRDGEFSLGPRNDLPLSPAVANYEGNLQYKGSPKGEYRKQTMPVQTFPPNAWGLYEMHGNTWEWVQDCYDNKEYARRAATPGGWLASQSSEEKPGCERIFRGGSWADDPHYLRSSLRGMFAPDFRGSSVGFRLARTLP